MNKWLIFILIIGTSSRISSKPETEKRPINNSLIIECFITSNWDSVLNYFPSIDSVNQSKNSATQEITYSYRLFSFFWLEDYSSLKEELAMLKSKEYKGIKKPLSKNEIILFEAALFINGGKYEEGLSYLKKLDGKFHEEELKFYKRAFKEYLLARTYIGLGNFPEAINHFLIAERVLVESQKLVYDFHFQINFGLSKAYDRISLPSTSLYYLEKASKIVGDHLDNSRKIKVEIDKQTSWIYSNQGKFRLADKALRTVETFYDETDVGPKEKANLYYRKGALYTRRDPKIAIGYFQSVIDLYEKHGLDNSKSRMIPGSLSSIALANEEMKDYEKAIIFQLQAIEIFEERLPANHPSIALAYMNLGRLYSLNLNHDEGLQSLKRSISLFSQYAKSDSSVLLKPYYFLAQFYSRFGAFDKAERFYLKSISVGTNTGKEDVLFSFKALTEIISVAIKTGNLDKAEKYFQKVDEFYTTKNKLYHSASVPSQVEKGSLLNFLNLRGKFLTDKGISTGNIYDLEKGFQFFEEAISKIDSIKFEYSKDYRKLIFSDDIVDIYNSSIDLLYKIEGRTKHKTLLEKSFGICEKKKSTILLSNLIKVDRFPVTVSEDDKVAIETLEETIDYLEDLIKHFESKSDSFRLEEINRKHFQAQKSYDSLKYILEEANPTFARSKYNSKVISLDKLQSILSPSEILLEYFRTDTALYAFAINREDVSFQKLTLPTNFDKVLSQFLLSSKTTPESDKEFKSYYAQQAHDLYKVLVEPLLDSLKPLGQEGKEQLIIVPDGKLGYLPWDALLTEYPQDVYDYRSYPFLLNEFSIRQAYSATLMKLLGDKEAEDKALMAAFAPSYLSKSQLVQAFKSTGGETCELPDEDDFVDLAQSSQELDEILANIKGTRFDTLNASEAKFKEIANDYRILHLTMHGFTDDCDPMYSGLAFTPKSMLEAAGISDTTNPTNEGILHAYEIYNMRLNAELVVMSACQTGLGKIQAGEGIMSLARAFAHAGSPNTVMSLWQVQESATRRLMESFYRHLSEGKGKDEALQLAKLDYLANNADAHPFYWAGFTLIGDDKPIVEDNWIEKNGWMLAIGLALLLAIFAVLRKYSSSART